MKKIKNKNIYTCFRQSSVNSLAMFIRYFLVLSVPPVVDKIGKIFTKNRPKAMVVGNKNKKV
jgi:hypothetical protein